MFAWQATVQNEVGNVVPFPVVTVTKADGGALASLFDESGAGLPNPLTGSAEGFVQFWVEDGEYMVSGVGGSDTTPDWFVSGIGVVDFYSRAEAEAASIRNNATRINVNEYGLKLSYIADPDGVALTTADGRKWSPDGVAHPEHFGAKQDEVSDSTAAFQAALKWMEVSPDRKLVDTFTGQRVFNGEIVSDGHLDWDAGNATYYLPQASRFLAARGNLTTTATPISADYVIGGLSLSAVLPVQPNAGDWLRIVSDAVNPNDRTRVGNPLKYRVQEFVQAGEGSVSGTLVLSRPLRFVEGMNDAEDAVIPAYTLASGARVALFDASKKFSFKGGNIKYAAGLTLGPDCITLAAYLNPKFEGINFHKLYGAAIALFGTIRAHISNCTATDLADIDPVQLGYGVEDGGEETTVIDCTFTKCRHAYTTLRTSIGVGSSNIFSGGNTVGAKVVRCVAHGCTSTSFDTHHGAVDCSFIDCDVYGGAVAYGGRGIGNLAVNCKSFGSTIGLYPFTETTAVAGNLTRYASSWTFDNCVIRCKTLALRTSVAKVTLRDTVLESASVRMITIDGSLVKVEGSVQLNASNQFGAIPLEDPIPATSVIQVNSSRAVYFPIADMTVDEAATLTIDVASFSSLTSALIGVSANCRFKLFGTLAVNAPNATSLYGNDVLRFIGTAANKLKVILPTTAFNLANAATKIAVKYDSDGVAL